MTARSTASASSWETSDVSMSVVRADGELRDASLRGLGLEADPPSVEASRPEALGLLPATRQ